MRTLWRWLARPVISVADAMLIATATLAADALKLGLHLPWPAVLAAVWGTLMVTFILISFTKSFIRSIRR